MMKVCFCEKVHFYFFCVIGPAGARVRVKKV